MSDVSVFLAPRDAALGARIADALLRSGHQARMIPANDGNGDLFPPETGDASIVIWSRAALKLARLHAQARDALLRGSLIPVAFGGARAPHEFESLPPVDLSGWCGDDGDPRWRFVLDEITIATGRQQRVSPNEAAPAATPEAIENEPGLPVEAEPVPLIPADILEEPPILAGESLRKKAQPQRRKKAKRYSPGAVAFGGVASLMLGSGAAIVLAPHIIETGAKSRIAAPELRDRDAVNLAVLQVSPGDEASLAADTPDIASAESALSTDADAAALAGPLPPAPVERETKDAITTDAVESLPPVAPPAEVVSNSSVNEQIAPDEGTFRDCSACPDMRKIEGSAFMMGTPTGQASASPDEGPVKQVTIANAFAIAAHETTYAEWMACVDDGGCRAYRPPAHGWGGGATPVASVSYNDALGYAAWLSEKTGHEYRLPSEAEWEYAARAGSDKAFAWGPVLQPDRANYDARYPYKGAKGSKSSGPAPAGAYAANAFGLYDMAGNLWEWTADCWASGIADLPSDGGARSGDCVLHVLKGGAWNTGGWRLRAGHRIGKPSTAREFDNGFRVVRAL